MRKKKSKQVSTAPMGKEKKLKAGIRGPDGQGKKKIKAGIRSPDGPKVIFFKQVSIAPMGQGVGGGGAQQVSEAPMG